MSASNTVKNAIGNHYLRNTAIGTPPAAVYLALYTSGNGPTDAGGGTECSGNGYARQQITFGAPGSPGVFANTNQPTFTASGGSIGPTATVAGIFDAATGGNFLMPATTSTMTAGAGASITFPAGTITCTIT